MVAHLCQCHSVPRCARCQLPVGIGRVWWRSAVMSALCSSCDKPEITQPATRFLTVNSGDSHPNYYH